jgi:hypothetical protein
VPLVGWELDDDQLVEIVRVPGGDERSSAISEAESSEVDDLAGRRERADERTPATDGVSAERPEKPGWLAYSLEPLTHCTTSDRVSDPLMILAT